VPVPLVLPPASMALGFVVGAGLGGGWNDLRSQHGPRLYKGDIAPKIIVSGGDLASEWAPRGAKAESMKRLLIPLGIPAHAGVRE
jgi:hypothetical protein